MMEELADASGAANHAEDLSAPIRESGLRFSTPERLDTAR